MAKKKKVGSYEEYPLDKLCLYAGIDCIVTLDLAKKRFGKVLEEPTYKLPNGTTTKSPSLIWELENFKMPAHEFIMDLQLTGMKYDVEKNKEMSTKMLSEISQLEAGIFDAIKKNPLEFNLDSDLNLKALLYDELKLTPPAFTASGAPSTDGDSLLALHKETKLDWLGWLAKRNDLASVYNSFLDKYVEKYVKRDGRIHPQYNMHGTSSHRISGDSPNLLNLPNPKYGYNVRDLYTVEDGMVFLAFDFSSCEVKVLGALSKDPKLLEAIANGLDFHSYTACAIHGINYDDFVAVLGDDKHSEYKRYKKLRGEAKATTFGILYGSSNAGIAMNLGIDTAEAEKLVSLYFDTFPLIKKYVDESHRMAEDNYFCFTPFGQRFQFPCLRPPYRYTAVFNGGKRGAQNKRIQSTASTLGLMAFTKANDEAKKCTAIQPSTNQQFRAEAILTVYDSLEISCPLPLMAQVIETVFYCMDDWPVEAFDWLDLPIGTDSELGFNFGQMKHIKRGVNQETCEKLLKQLNPIRYQKTKEFWS